MKNNIKKVWVSPKIVTKLPLKETMTLQLMMGNDGGQGNAKYTS
jgi:hypothetical protein